MSLRKIYSAHAVTTPATTLRRTVRKHLNADTLFSLVQKDFQKIPDCRADNSKISLDDALMSALAVFQLKDPSLLAFDKRRRGEPENLRTVFGIDTIPCDSQMRTILDPLALSSLRAPFCSVFRQVQRGKDFEKMAFYDGHYLLSGDGTGYYSSAKVSSPYCLSKKSKNGEILYYQQIYAASFVCPGCKVGYDQISEDYLAGTSTGRTLSEYYSRRQYPGSPPFIPHKVEEPDLARVECLACHLRGGWTEELKKNTPVTPHPEQEACQQCHITVTEAKLFVETDWKSVAPPRLGRASLPGAPPPVPHDIQMRGNCVSCHVGPGTVAAIRVEHPSRGNCRQCHVPETNAPPWQRQPKPG